VINAHTTELERLHARLAELERKLAKPRAQHSAATPDWGTSRSLLELERAVLGRIDIDPFSSAKWNAVVGAWRFIDETTDGRTTPWGLGFPRPQRIAWLGSCDAAERLRLEAMRARPGGLYTAHVNAPGDKRGELVADAWRILAAYVELGWITAACYVGFSVEQLARLQRVGAISTPLDHWTLIPAERQPFLTAPGVAGEEPTHASFVTLLGGTDDQIQLFHRLGERLGVVTRRSRR